MQVQSVEDRVATFLDKKFRYSKSYATRQTYRLAMNKFTEFLRSKHGIDLNQLVVECEDKVQDPVSLLDGYYTYLMYCKLKTGKIGYSNSSMTTQITVAKEFLNSQNLHIYNEDLKQKFRLPKKIAVFEEGLTKDVLVRLLHNCTPKLQTAILMCASSGMRLGELVQLKTCDIDFTTTPTTIKLRQETTKTRETRFTHISAEATNALKDYLHKTSGGTEEQRADKYIFLKYEGDTQTAEYDRAVRTARSTFVEALELTIKKVPELSVKNENGRNRIHFHAFRAWFKTQVTNAHQSDFAEALMGHKSLKLLYYRQNPKDRQRIYLEVEPALTISDFTKVEATIEDLKAELASLKIELEKQRQRIEIAEKYERKTNY